MFHILIDTCVWLDLAKDPYQQALLGVLERLVSDHEIAGGPMLPIVHNLASVPEEDVRALGFLRPRRWVPAYKRH